MYHGKKKGRGLKALGLFKVSTPWDFHKQGSVVHDLFPFPPY